jgi:hypothetical protein
LGRNQPSSAGTGRLKVASINPKVQKRQFIAWGSFALCGFLEGRFISDLSRLLENCSKEARVQIQDRLFRTLKSQAPAAGVPDPASLPVLPLDRVTLSARAVAGAVGFLPSDKEMAAQAEAQVRESLRKVPETPGRSRHAINALVQSQKPGEPATQTVKAHYDGSPVVVIAFEGTGGFDARRPALMQSLGRELQAQGHDTTDSRFRPAQLLDKALQKVRGRDAHWSGLASGPLQEIVKDPELNNNIQWLSFPSEEVELLSDAEAYKDIDALQLVGDIKRSTSGTSRGIDDAVARVTEIAREAQKQGKSPKFVLVTHSSGGRSAVKFAEKLGKLRNPSTGEPFQIEKALTIDPVREAHEAFLEAGREVINKKTEQAWNKVRTALGFRPKKVYPPNIGSRHQPGSLYRPQNVNQWVNFYQRTDTEGLKMAIEFGIHGSPIRGAENHEIKDTSTDGHGAIAYHSRVLDRMTSELRDLVQAQSS